MYAKLNYLYFLSVLALCLGSCVSGRLGNGEPESLELSFTASDQTRACVAANLNTEGSRFAVYGDMKFEKDDERIPPSVIFNGTEVAYNKEKGSWSYGGTQYWFPRHEHSFIAVHPADAVLSGTDYSESRLSFSYSLPEDFTDANDLMVATHRRKLPEDRLLSSADCLPVRFNFFHIMSRLDFQVTNDKAADVLKVTDIKIELQGVKTTRKFAIVPAYLLPGSSETYDYSFVDDNRSLWTDTDNSNEDIFIAEIVNPGIEIAENGSGFLFPDDNALFMIPQPENKNIKMKVTIDYELWDDGEPFETKLQLTTGETPIAIGGWEMGKVYTYSMTVSEITKEIDLTVSVKPWHPEKNNDIVVPES